MLLTNLIDNNEEMSAQDNTPLSLTRRVTHRFVSFTIPSYCGRPSETSLGGICWKVCRQASFSRLIESRNMLNMSRGLRFLLPPVSCHPYHPSFTFKRHSTFPSIDLQMTLYNRRSKSAK